MNYEPNELRIAIPPKPIIFLQNKPTMKQLLFFCVASVLVASCNDKKSAGTEQSSFNMDSVRAQISASNALYGDSFGKNDSASFINSYTSDACINPPGMPKMCGREAIATFFREGVKMGVKRIVLTTDELLGGKEGVIESGHYDLQGEGGVSLEKGKFIVRSEE